MLKRSWAFAFAALLFAGCSNSSTPVAPIGRNGDIIAAGPTSSGGAEVDTFLSTATGNVAPLTSLTSTAMYLAAPYGIVNDGAGNLWLGSCNNIGGPGTGPGLSKFPITASGAATPTVNISGSNTMLGCVPGVALDAAGTVYASGFVSNAIYAFAAGASGNVAPTATLSGAATGLDAPFGIFIKSGKLYVANSNNAVSPGSLEVFPAGASGNVAPTATISGATTTLGTPTQIWVDARNNIWVADYTASAVDEFAPGASGNVAPIASISGSNTGIVNPYAMAVDSFGFVYVGTRTGGGAPVIEVFAPGATGNVAPVQTIVPTPTALQYIGALTLR